MRLKWMGPLLLGLLASAPVVAQVDQENLEEYGRGIISDYSQMHPMGEIEYAWIKPGVTLSKHAYVVDKVENLTILVDEDMLEPFLEVMPKQLNQAARAADGAPTLHVQAGVYWAEHANLSKAWIPFAGAHVAQAGVGVELIFRNEAGDVVARIRQSGREGRQLALSSQGLSDDVARFVRNH